MGSMPRPQTPTPRAAAPDLDVELERLSVEVTPAPGGYFLSHQAARDLVEEYGEACALLDALEAQGIIRDGALVTEHGLEPILPPDRRGLE